MKQSRERASGPCALHPSAQVTAATPNSVPTDDAIFDLRTDTQPLTSAFGVVSLHDRIEQPDSPVWSRAEIVANDAGGYVHPSRAWDR